MLNKDPVSSPDETSPRGSTRVAALFLAQPQGWAGILLILICWPLNWSLPGMRTAYLFFPLWLGYILVVDALVFARAATSMWTRSKRGFLLLFVASAPVWWLFEAINSRTGNWEYLGSAIFTPLQYYFLCTLSFSTVMPAVFESAELIGTLRWLQRLRFGPQVPDTFSFSLTLFAIGVVMLALTFLWPRYCYPFVWTSLALILEPLNRWSGGRYLTQRLHQGDWRVVVSLSLGALLCGFFWEMWNYYSYPKWIYHTPGAQFWHIFEMPLLGYGGYIPFALELYGLKNLFWRGKSLAI